MLKLRIIIVFLFLGATGCLYTCNYAPPLQVYGNTDPCFQDTTVSELVDFANITGGQSKMTLSIIMKLPCTGPDVSHTYSFAFYDKNNVNQATDLTNMVDGTWGLRNVSCKNADSQAQEDLKTLVKSRPDLYATMQGSAITIGTGQLHPNRLYPYYVKVSIDNPGAAGQPRENGVGGCVNNPNMDPFIVDSATLSPIFVEDKPITVVSGEVGLALYPYQLVYVTAPFYTYGTLLKKKGEEDGIKSTPGQSSQGSFFTFDVHLKPGEYYVVISKVPSPMAAAAGNFNLADPKIYGKNRKTLKYEQDCNKDIVCQNKALSVKVI